MWETELVCTACSGTHTMSAAIIPRAFSYTRPRSGEHVELPFRDPSRTPEPWREVNNASPGAIEVDPQGHGTLDI